MILYKRDFQEKIKNIPDLPKWLLGKFTPTEEIVEKLAAAGVEAKVIESYGYPAIEVPSDFMESENFRNFIAKKQASKNAFEDRVAKKAKELGLPSDSKTALRFATGQIDSESAHGIAKFIRDRHQKTSYDSLLDFGVSKDQAREIIRDEGEN